MPNLTTVTGFTPAVLIKNIRELGDAVNFLLNTIFSARQQHSNDVINLAETSMNVRVLPVVGRDEPAIQVAHASSTMKAVIPPLLRVGQEINEAVAMTPMFGGETYQGGDTDLNAALRERITAEQRRIRKSFETTLESWCAQILATGKMTFLGEDGNARYEVDFGYVTTGTAAARNIQADLTGDNLWTSDNANILTLLEALEKQIRDHSQYAGKLDVILGTTALAALRTNAKVYKMLDNRRMLLGQLSTARGNNYVGTLGTFDFYKYSRSTLASTGSTRTELWDATKIAMVPSEGRESGFGIHYGAIFESPDGRDDTPKQFIRTDWYSKMYGTQDPPSDRIIVASKPLPIITDIRPIRIQKVVA